jgi:hypothetical protein
MRALDHPSHTEQVARRKLGIEWTNGASRPATVRPGAPHGDSRSPSRTALATLPVSALRRLTVLDRQLIVRPFEHSAPQRGHACDVEVCQLECRLARAPAGATDRDDRTLARKGGTAIGTSLLVIALESFAGLGRLCRSHRHRLAAGVRREHLLGHRQLWRTRLAARLSA